eukprot:CAMPEP_0197248002 /NCGR_PEP_ID=MMETSP1429-20130617/32612_1 /TAXON_ID=49237 /ORGANISM="Chaetoceros  sp., Strain UNC1202" /LENGTH=156 /DNA_ID=CAMNT_0042709063 /DNA_START=34 /DNA_END=504 /DNA_ORIENTATION=+
MASSAAAQVTTRAQIISSYRTITRLVKLLPSNQKPEKQLTEVRQTFQKNASLTDPDEISSLLNKAGEKIAYLRIVTPKKKISSAASEKGTSTTRWIYTKEGAVEIGKDGKGTLRDGKGRVVSNWSGKNMDPCSIKTHSGQLKRMGFANNLHAKGLF